MGKRKRRINITSNKLLFGIKGREETGEQKNEGDKRHEFNVNHIILPKA